MHEAGALTVAMPPSSCTTLQPPSPTRRDQALHLGQWALAIAHLMCVSGPAGAVNEAAGPPADPAAADVPPPPGKPSKRRRLQEQQQHPLLCQGSAAGGSSQASEAQPHALLLCGLLPLLVPAFKLALRSVGGQAGQPELVAALGLLIPHLTATQASTLVQGGVGLVVSELMEQLMTATPSASGAEGQQPQLGKAAGAAAAPAAIAQPGGVADVCAWEGRAHGFPWWNPTALDCLVILLQLTRLSGGGAGEGAWCSSLTHAHVLSGIGALLHTHSPPHDSPAAGLSAPSAQGTPGAVCHNAGAPPAAEAAATGPPAYRSQGVQGKAEYAARLAWGGSKRLRAGCTASPGCMHGALMLAGQQAACGSSLRVPHRRTFLHTLPTCVRLPLPMAAAHHLQAWCRAPRLCRQATARGVVLWCGLCCRWRQQQPHRPHWWLDSCPCCKSWPAGWSTRRCCR